MSTWKRFQSPNLGLLFYKQVYKERPILIETDNQTDPNISRLRTEMKGDNIELTIYVDKNNKKKKSPFDDFYKDLYNQTCDSFSQCENAYAIQKFILKTTYPGLLIGSGYSHDTKATGDFKLGFFFDYTTGQPIIPGSSIKGVCRSIFEKDVKDGINYTGDQSIASVRFIFNEILEAQTHNCNSKEKETITSIMKNLTVNKLKTLVLEMFGKDTIKGSDLFFDAVLHINSNRGKTFLANDYITAHFQNPLQNPNPVQFLKVKSQIAFEFRFRLTNSGDWTDRIKELFFRQVLMTVGVGAKTNVGYGQFVM